jgi:uncharacterized membrane protein YfhO
MNKLKFLPVLILFLLTVIFFKSFVFQGNLPIPSDTIVGLYYPFRDAYFKTNPNGLPYKNFLVTDPVRQQYPWKNLALQSEKKLELPLWNRYNFSGTPLLANFQAGAFYPFNIIFFILPFDLSWSLIIFLQPLLAGIFLFYYLRHLKIQKIASLFGAVSYSFSGFFIAWLEWGNILNTVLWLPLILLSVDKINEEIKLKTTKKVIGWSIVLLVSLLSSFFAGHLQTFFYILVFSSFYFLLRLINSKDKVKSIILHLSLGGLFIAASAIQWLPTIKFITLSARSIDVVGWRVEGWFIPWQNIIQFVAPDFFGNPATLNYYGIWNYAEFIGYVGILPLMLAVFALLFRRDKKTYFFGLMLIASLVLAFPTLIAKIPFKFEFPFISTSQPTRLIFIIDFCLAVLASFGLDYFMRIKNKKIMIPITSIFALIFIILWGIVIFSGNKFISAENLITAKQNLILPTIIFLVVAFIIKFLIFYKKKEIKGINILNFTLIILFVITVFDLFRFGWKFEPFTNKNYLFPSTKVTEFLQKQQKPFRVLSVDSRIMPPNFSIMYGIEVLDGYDPLYLQRYGELMAASGRGKPDISSPFGFNRIITPQDPLSKISDMLGTKFILSLNDRNDEKLSLVFTDGIIKVYQNKQALPRAFFVDSTYIADSKQSAINAMFEPNYQLSSRAVVEEVKDKSLFKNNWGVGAVSIKDYQDNKVILETKNEKEGFLVLTDSYYPSWHATIDGKETKIYITNFNFRGIIVPKGKHKIEFYISLL